MNDHHALRGMQTKTQRNKQPKKKKNIYTITQLQTQTNKFLKKRWEGKNISANKVEKSSNNFYLYERVTTTSIYTIDRKGTTLVHLKWHNNLYYDTRTSFDKCEMLFEKNVTLLVSVSIEELKG